MRVLSRVIVVVVLALGSLATMQSSASAATGNLLFPVQAGGSIGALVGDCRPVGACSRAHAGYDIGGSRGTPIVAAHDGRVVEAIRGHTTAGNYLEVDHGDGYATQYLHLDGFAVSFNQVVGRGQVIGYMGDTGSPGAVHLHFEVLDYNAGRNTNRRTAQTWNDRDEPGTAGDGVFEGPVPSPRINLNDILYRNRSFAGGASIPFSLGVEPNPPAEVTAVRQQRGVDLDGNGVDDVLWYSPGSDDDYLWRLNAQAGHTSHPKQINGDYTAIPGDYDGDGSGDVFWYTPGESPDFIWFFTSTGGHTSSPATVNGTYTPISGDFDGNGVDDIFWYGPGTTSDFLWRFQDGGSFVSTPKTVNGTYKPIVGDFTSGGIDDILWYAPGSSTDALWRFTSTGGHSQVIKDVSGSYAPLVGDFDGNRVQDVFWYSPDAGDFVWRFDAAGGHTTLAKTVTQTYTPLVGNFDGDNDDDVLWYGAGSTSDFMWWFGAGGAHTSVAQPVGGTYEPFIGDFDGNDVDDVFWYAASASDFIWRFQPDRSYVTVAKSVTNPYTPIA